MPVSSSSPERYAMAAFDALSAHVAILDETGVVLAVNRAWRAFAEGNGGSGELGTNYLKLCRQVEGPDREDALALERGIGQVLGGQVDAFEWEYPCHSPSEQRYFVARVTRFSQDGATYALVAHENITRRKRAELEVREFNRTLEARVGQRTLELGISQRALELRNRELEISNRELSQFATVASHDLQEPLRTLSLHADMLRERYRGRQLDERADRYLMHIVAQAGRARRLVQDVLTMAGITADGVVDAVDLGALLPELLESLNWPAAAPFGYRELPPVRANVAQMRQLLANLLGNALKFSEGRELAVEVTGQAGGGMVAFEVADAGIGIADEHRDHVFEMFRRLHNRTPTSGNGIGLAVCRKIVERHGGRIWITGNARGGTSVHFTLPAAGPDAAGPCAAADHSEEEGLAPEPGRPAGHSTS